MSENQKTDRRIVRTRQQLRQALFSLVFEKSYDRISVQDILDRANIGRSTFYAHFRDKDDLLLDAIPGKILDFDETSDELVPSLVPIFTHAQEFFDFFRALMGNEGIALAFKTAHQQMMRDWLAHINRLQAKGVASGLPPVVMAHYLTGAFGAVFQWWLDEKMPYSPIEMDRMFRQLTEQKIQS